MAESKAKPTYLTGKAGSLFIMEGVKRRVKIYGIQESELHSLAMLNTLATFRYALAGSLFSGSFALLSGLLIEGSPSEFACRIVPILSAIGVAFSIVFAIAGYWASKTKTSELNRIKSEAIEE